MHSDCLKQSTVQPTAKNNDLKKMEGAYTSQSFQFDSEHFRSFEALQKL